MKLNQEAFQNLIFPWAVDRPVCWADHFGQSAPLEVEIGSGLGEYIVQKAAESGDKNFIGIEYDRERMIKSLRRLHKTTLKNVRFLQSDARLVFERLISPSSVHFVYSLFPCPWPKKKHAKHRLFNKDFLQLINSRLVADGHLKIVTDHFPYVEWIDEEVIQSGFTLQVKSIDPQFQTKFEKKWLEGGQEKFFELTFSKKEHIKMEAVRDAILEERMVQEFNPEEFSMQHLTGRTSVIFKEFLYDQVNRKAMVRLVVIERNIKQHLWIAIVRKEDGWRIFPSEGSVFIPTEGIQLAIETVFYRAGTARPSC